MASGLNSYAQQGGAATASPTPLQSSESAALAGTNGYNSLSKGLSAPNSSGGVVQDTMKNMGTGQSAEDALTNAAKTNASNGLSKDLPTANSNSTVVQDTMKNMGAGQSAEDALTNAAQSAATNAAKSAASPTR